MILFTRVRKFDHMPKIKKTKLENLELFYEEIPVIKHSEEAARESVVTDRISRPRRRKQLQPTR